MCKQLDWAIMIERLNKDLSIDQISKKTGIAEPTVRKVKGESMSIVAWDKAIALFDLYLKHYGTDVPRYGDHNV